MAATAPHDPDPPLLRRSAPSDRANLTPDRRSVPSDRANLTPDRRSVPSDRANLTPDRRSVPSDRANLTPDRRSVPSDRANLTPDRRSVPSDRANLTPDRANLTPDRRSAPSDRANLTPDRANLAPDRRSAPSDRANLAPDRRSPPPIPRNPAPDRNFQKSSSRFPGFGFLKTNVSTGAGSRALAPKSTARPSPMKRGGEIMSIIQNSSKIVATCGQRLTALKKYVKTKTAMTASGKQTKLAELVAIYQAAIDTRAALIPQQAAYKQALAARNSAEVTRQATDKQLKAWVVNEFGADSAEAQEFGFSPPKIGAVTTETRYHATLQSKATRVARGTRGKRQKEKIKGTVVVPAAPAEPAVTVPAAAPAASTSPNEVTASH